MADCVVEGGSWIVVDEGEEENASAYNPIMTALDSLPPPTSPQTNVEERRSPIVRVPLHECLRLIVQLLTLHWDIVAVQEVCRPFS